MHSDILQTSVVLKVFDKNSQKRILVFVTEFLHGISKTQSWETQWQLQRIIQKAGSSTPMFEIAWGQVILGREDFSLGHNGLITFSIFVIVFQIDVDGQIIAKE